MPVVDSMLEQQREESDSLEKGNVQKSGLQPLGSGDSDLTPAGVPHEDDPLVCFITTVFVMLY
jgi:hypothetical protein